MYKLKPKDLIAILSIILITILKLKGVNGTLDTVIALILGYYFGHRISGADNGK